MVSADKVANAYNTSEISYDVLKSTSHLSLAIAECMVHLDPTPLIDRLMTVKPDGLSLNAWRTRAGLSQAVFTDIRRRGNAKLETVERLLDAIGITLSEFDAGVKQTEKDPPSAAVRAPYLAFRGDDRPRDVPIVGTALCADIELPDGDGPVEVEAMSMDLNEVIDRARRPLTLDRRPDVYALYFRGVSMSPRYEPGEIGYVDPKRPPSTGDYVIAQLRGRGEYDGDRVGTVIAKKLVRQSATFYEFEQFNPPLVFRVERKQVLHLHRIIPWDELVTF